MQKLSKRLQSAADFVTQGSRVADIGTDHGFLPIYLIQSGRCPQAVAMDIRKGPLERAQEHILAAGLEKRIRVRLSDGIQGLSEGEADSVVIAGMGGLTVIHILEEAQGRLAWFQELVLEPQSDIAKVRRYLREHSLHIDQEDLVYESGKFYPILHVSINQKKPEQACPEGMQQIQKLLLQKLADEERVRSLLDRYGECTVYDRHPVILQLLERDERRELGILREIEKGEAGSGAKQQNVDTAGGRKREVERRLEEIRILQKIIGRKHPDII